MIREIQCHENKKKIPGHNTQDKPIHIPNPSPKNPGYDDTDGDNRNDGNRSPDPQ